MQSVAKRLLFLAIVGFVALPACATDFASHHLLIPAAGRTPGAFGSAWRTDLVLTNANRRSEPLTAELYLVVDGVLTPPVVTLLNPLQTVVIPDAIKTAFGREEAQGLILIAVRDPDAKLTARARVYNVGSAHGQYGQTIPAMPLTKLSKEAYLPGLSGVDGNRTNVGIANPDSTPADVFISIFDVEGSFSGGFSTSVAPYSVLRLNDVFSHFQTGPLDGAMIKVRSSHGVYPYASIVRNDSGDADFVVATGTEIDESDVVAAPQCASPATLSLAALPADGWTVIFKPGVNPFVTTPSLEARHGFVAERIYQFGGFHTRYLTQKMIAAMRCEDTVRVIEQNGFVPLG